MRREPTARSPSRTSLALLCMVALAGAIDGVHPVHAHAQVFAEELRARGFWPDVALAFGAGIGLGHALDTPVFGRLRVGALYAYEPLVVNLGVSAELGALAGRGFGAELELNHFGGPFVQLGLDRVTDRDFMTHAMLGFSLFGLEWQHRLDSSPSDALLFVLRAPIGIWWFLLKNERPARRGRRDRSARAGRPRRRLRRCRARSGLDRRT
jgi:hypothetical protein